MPAKKKGRVQSTPANQGDSTQNLASETQPEVFRLSDAKPIRLGDSQEVPYRRRSVML
jgi:hypothetical protein